MELAILYLMRVSETDTKIQASISGIGIPTKFSTYLNVNEKSAIICNIFCIKKYCDVHFHCQISESGF
jgi:hypothetical protein